MRDMVALNVNASLSPLDKVLGIFTPQPWIKLVKAFVKTLSPLFPLLALWAILFRRERSILLALTLTLAIIFTTLVYEFRLLYLLPYFLVLVASLFKRIDFKPLKPVVQRLSLAFLLILLIWSVGVSIVVRSAFAYNDGAQRKRNLIEKAARSHIGVGDHKVFLGFTYEFYFTGRALGWQMYTPYIQFSFDDEGNWIRKDDFRPKDRFLKLMSEMDYAIFSGDQIDDDLSAQLASSGLRYRGPIHIGNPQLKVTDANADRSANDIFLRYLEGAPSYGPYMLFERQKPKASAQKTLTLRSDILNH